MMTLRAGSAVEELRRGMSDGLEREKPSPVKTGFGVAVAAVTYYLINWHGWLWAVFVLGGTIAVGAAVDHQMKARKNASEM